MQAKPTGECYSGRAYNKSGTRRIRFGSNVLMFGCYMSVVKLIPCCVCTRMCAAYYPFLTRNVRWFM